MRFVKRGKHDHLKTAEVQPLSQPYQKNPPQVEHSMLTLVPSETESLDLAMAASQAIENARHYSNLGTDTPPLTPGHLPKTQYYPPNISTLPTPPRSPRNVSPERQDSAATMGNLVYTDSPQAYGKAGFVLTVSRPRALSAASHRNPTKTEVSAVVAEVPAQQTSAHLKSKPSKLMQSGEKTASYKLKPNHQPKGGEATIHDPTSLSRSSTKTASSRSATVIASAENPVLAGIQSKKSEPKVGAHQVKTASLDPSASAKSSSSSRFSWSWIKGLGKAKPSTKEDFETKPVKQRSFSAGKSSQKEKRSTNRDNATISNAPEVRNSERSTSLRRPFTSGGKQTRSQHDISEFSSHCIRPSTSQNEVKPWPSLKGKEKAHVHEIAEKKTSHLSCSGCGKINHESACDLHSVHQDKPVIVALDSGDRTVRRFPSLNFRDENLRRANDVAQSSDDDKTPTQKRGKHVLANEVENVPALPSEIQPPNPDNQVSKGRLDDNSKHQKARTSQAVKPVESAKSDNVSTDLGGYINNVDVLLNRQSAEATAQSRTKGLHRGSSQIGNDSDLILPSPAFMPEITLTTDDIPLKGPSRPPSDRSVSTSKSVSFDPSITDSDRTTARLKPKSAMHVTTFPPKPYQSAYPPSKGITTRPKSTVQYMVQHNEQTRRHYETKRLTTIEKQILEQASMRHLVTKPKERKLAGFDPTPDSSVRLSSDTSSLKSSKQSSSGSKRHSLVQSVLSVKGKDRRSVDGSEASSIKSKLW